MRFAFTEEQRIFQSILRDLLAEECSPKALREASRDPGARSRDRLRRLAELGLTGIPASEVHGGLGGDEVDLVLALEETGYACLPEPAAEAYVVSTLLRGTDLEGEWLARIVSGDALVTIGPRSAVPFAGGADLVLIADADGTAGLEPGFSATAKPSLDPTRPLFEVAGERTSLPASFDDVLDRAAFAVAAQLVGVGRRVVEMAADYAKDRRQFGVPIGSFQAVKHLLADAHLAVEFAAPVVYRAAWSLARGDPNRSRDASMAKAMASDAALAACRAGLQVHGAIGYTEEHDLHLWLKRGLSLASSWGDAARHRERVRGALLRRRV